MSELYIGLMSGTSVDGIDAALVDLKNNVVTLKAFVYLPFSVELQKKLQRISKPNALISLLEYGELDAKLGELFADVVNSLLQKTNLPATKIQAIGSHGQTVYHAPDAEFPFTLQIGDPNRISARTGITTIADFRRKDIAVGGQGAPLVPAFHQAVFTHDRESRCVVNIGGIANVTVLPARCHELTEKIVGFDTGMGNTLMNQWTQKHCAQAYDEHGAWARSGKIIDELVTLLKQDFYFHLPPPKSTGVDYFSLAWLKSQLMRYETPLEPADVQASLCYLTALTIAEAIKNYAPNTAKVLLCGGGVHNYYLVELLNQQLNCVVESTENYGIHPDHVEAIAFAWLAKQTLNHQTGNVKEVTGATKNVVLGGIYQFSS